MAQAGQGADRTPANVARVDALVTGALALAAVVVVSTVVDLLGRGLDLTDGGNSWSLTVDPGASPLTVSQAGHVHHVLFGLLGHDEVLFQRANGLATVALVAVLGWVVLRRGRPEADGPPGRDLAVALAVGAGATALLFQWQSPPNYKWLTFQGLTLVAIGVLAPPRRHGRDRTGSRRDLAGALGGEVAAGMVLGLGGWLAFMARPPSAAAAALLVVAHALATRTSLRRLLAAATTAGLLLLGAAVAIDGSVAAFVADLTTGLDLAGTRTDVHTLGSLVRPQRATWPTTTSVGLVVATVLLLPLLLRSGDRDGPASHDRTAAPAWGVAAIVVVTCLAAVAVVRSTWSWFPGFHTGMGVWALPIPAAAALVALADPDDDHRRGGRRVVADTLLLLLVPVAFAVGSANNYWHEASRAAVFWVLAAVPLLGWTAPCTAPRTGRADGRVAVAVAAGLLATAGLVHVGITSPYRQDVDLRAMETPAPGLVDLDGLLVSRAQASFLGAMVRGAREEGFVAGTGVVDLSGATPGLAPILGATPLGASWLLGDYPGSTPVAIDLLGRVPCADLARAWVVEAPGDHRALDPEVAASIGLEPATDLRAVAAATTPENGTIRRLSVPTRPPEVATAACERARGGMGFGMPRTGT